MYATIWLLCTNVGELLKRLSLCNPLWLMLVKFYFSFEKSYTTPIYICIYTTPQSNTCAQLGFFLRNWSRSWCKKTGGGRDWSFFFVFASSWKKNASRCPFSSNCLLWHPMAVWKGNKKGKLWHIQIPNGFSDGLFSLSKILFVDCKMIFIDFWSQIFKKNHFLVV